VIIPPPTMVTSSFFMLGLLVAPLMRSQENVLLLETAVLQLQSGGEILRFVFDAVKFAPPRPLAVGNSLSRR